MLLVKKIMKLYLKRIYYLIIGLFIIFIIDSCSTYIAPSLSGANNIGYLPRPTQADSVKSKTYISGDFGYYADDNNVLKLNLGSVNLSKGYYRNKINYAYGAFITAGIANYKNPKPNGFLPVQNFSKSIYGGGIRTTIGLQPTTEDENFSFRILNWENAFSIESGGFSKVRNDLFDNTPHTSGDSYTAVSPLKTLYTTGLSTEGIFNSKWNNKNCKFGYRVFAGYSPFLERTFKEIQGRETFYSTPPALIFNLFVQINKIFGVLEFNNQYYSGGRLTIGYTL